MDVFASLAVMHLEKGRATCRRASARARMLFANPVRCTSIHRDAIVAPACEWVLSAALEARIDDADLLCIGETDKV